MPLTIRCRLSRVAERSTILDELMAIAGYYRWYAARLLLSGPAAERQRRRPRVRYGLEVREALGTLS